MCCARRGDEVVGMGWPINRTWRLLQSIHKLQTCCQGYCRTNSISYLLDTSGLDALVVSVAMNWQLELARFLMTFVAGGTLLTVNYSLIKLLWTIWQ